MNIFRKIFYKSLNKIIQNNRKRKFEKYNIPIKKGNYWYYKNEINYDGNIKYYYDKYDSTSMSHFEDYTWYGLHFHFEYGKYINVDKGKVKDYKDFTHSHDFWTVLETVYNYPETFKIPKKSEFEYSEQELKWIESLRKKCLKDGLKDIGYFTEPLTENVLMGEAFNIGELKKRGITKMNGIRLKKYYKKYSDDKYIILNKDWKLILIEK